MTIEETKQESWIKFGQKITEKYRNYTKIIEWNPEIVELLS